MTNLSRALIWTALAGALPVYAQTGISSDAISAPEPNVAVTAGASIEASALMEPVRAEARGIRSASTLGESLFRPTPRSLNFRDIAQMDAALAPSYSSSALIAAASEPLQDAPAPAAKPKAFHAGWSYFALTAALFGSSVANSETLARCQTCGSIPESERRRGVTYGAGLPLDAAVSWLGYHLKKKEHRWWFVPGAALTAANAALAYHWAVTTN